MSQSVAEYESTGRIEAGHFLYGLIAEFEHADSVLSAARRVTRAGYKKVDAYTPFPVEGLSEAVGCRCEKVPWIMLAAGLLGGGGMFGFLRWCMEVDYPFNTGGRPMYAWPTLIPITFELTVLSAALVGVAAMFIMNGLPQPYHPVFDAPNFKEATSSRFFLCIEATDPKFDREETRTFLEGLGAARVSEVELRK